MPYKTISVQGQTHVLKTLPEGKDGPRNPNYRNSGMALCGILLPGETLATFLVRAAKNKREIEIRNKIRKP